MPNETKDTLIKSIKQKAPVPEIKSNFIPIPKTIPSYLWESKTKEEKDVYLFSSLNQFCYRHLVNNKEKKN